MGGAVLKGIHYIEVGGAILKGLSGGGWSCFEPVCMNLSIGTDFH